jgi:hypothetical protein
MKARFFQDLHVCNLPKGRVSIDRDLTYFSPYLHRLTGDGYVHIPTGFVCDLTSLRFLGLVSRGAWDRAAAIHDLLYKTGCHASTRLTKADCDAVFVEAMKALHTHPARVAIYREGVRWLAWPAWFGHRRRDRRKRSENIP